MILQQLAPQQDYIDNQLEMGHNTDYLPNQDPSNPVLEFYFPNLPETQEATGLDLGMYNTPMITEDFAIIFINLDSIIHRINIMINDIANHTT